MQCWLCFTCVKRKVRTEFSQETATFDSHDDAVIVIQISVSSVVHVQSFGHSAKNCRSKQNVLSVERIFHTKDAQIEKPGNQNVLTVRGPHVAFYKRCTEYKKQAFRQHVVSKQKHMPQ